MPSARNPDLVRRAFASLIAGDFEYVLAEPGVASRHRGPDALAKAMGEYLSAWDEYHHHPERYLDAGDRVVVLARERGRAKAGGPEIRTEAATVWTFREGKLARVEAYQSHVGALPSRRHVRLMPVGYGVSRGARCRFTQESSRLPDIR